MSQFVFHMISSAHIDPVWLWDYREGFNEGLITCRTVLDLMDEDPELTFIRGEAAIYQHIERTDPEMFERIRKYVNEGRWDVVGGTFVQPDENLPATETLIRQYVRGQQYFKSRFGKPVEVAWSADCFGHTAGLPMILNSAGLKQFAFTRPLKPECALPGCAFWWEGPGESRVLAYRPLCDWYCIERTGMLPRLDQTLAEAPAEKCKTFAVLYGLGNHGGGPTRRHVREIREWAKQHPEVKIVFSTWHKFFAALQAEIATKPAGVIPTFKGEIGFTERGCYTSLAKLKYQYHKAAAAVRQAERTNAILSAGVGAKKSDLHRAWDSILFNSFHDILPGTCIERAADGQIAQLGLALREADEAELSAINALAMKVDTRVDPPADSDMPCAVSMLVWNPRSVPFDGCVELESSLDWRPIWKYLHRASELPFRLLDANGMRMPFQSIESESNAHPGLPWRKRVLAPMKIAPMGWSMVQMAYVREEDIEPQEFPTKRAYFTGDAIENGIYKIDTYVGARGVRIRRNGKLLLGASGLQFGLYDDPWGSWGKPEWDEQKTDTPVLNHLLKVSDVRVLESGPWRASLWVRFQGENSRLDLTLRVYAEQDKIEVLSRVLFDERLGRLKLIFPAGDRATFDVPGATVDREPNGEMPGQRWVRVHNDQGGFGLISDSLSGYDASDGQLRATVVRSGRYAWNPKIVEDKPWLPASDSGELKFKFIMTTGEADLDRLAEELEHPLVALPVPAKPGALPREGSFLQIEGDGLKVLAFKIAEQGESLILRLQETRGHSITPTIRLMNTNIALDRLKPGEIASWRIESKGQAWTAKRCTATELD